MNKGRILETFLVVVASTLLSSCGTVKDDVLIAYPERPLLVPDQIALIDWGVRGDHNPFQRHNDQFMLLRISGYNAVNVGTWNGYKQMAVKPGVVPISGNLIMDGSVTRKVKLVAGHEYEILQVPFVQIGGRVMTPDDGASAARDALSRALPLLVKTEAAYETHKMLLAYFSSGDFTATSDNPEFLRILNNYKRRGLLVVKDKTTGSMFTSDDPESEKAFTILRTKIPDLLKRAKWPIVLTSPKAF